MKNYILPLKLKRNWIRPALFLIFLLAGFQSQLFAQNGSVGIGTETPNSKAILDISSASKGILIPRLTEAQRNSQIQADGTINTAINGMLIYNIDANRFNFWLKDKWYDVSDGSMGPQGVKGDKGDSGLTGPIGLTGPQGSTGAQGIQGIKGDKGDTGLAGPIGLTGFQGQQGIKGDKGDIGLTGTIGLTGLQGSAGPTGAKGDKGDKGDIGLTGPIGLTGSQGSTGTQGIQGVKGDKGDQGNIGLTGAAGPQGSTGLTGPAGAAGAKGDKGNTGSSGINGTALTSNSGSPDNANGQNGDFYLDVLTGDVYAKESGTWNNTGNIRGPVGPSPNNVWLTNGNAGITPGTSGDFLGTRDGVDFVVATNSSERLRIKSTGNIGIGTISPIAKLDVNGTFKFGQQGTVLSNIVKTSVVADLPSIAPGASLKQFFTVANAAVGASVTVNPNDELVDGLIISYCRVAAIGSVEVKFTNISNLAIDVGAIKYIIKITQ